jgi:hypothetical protein
MGSRRSLTIAAALALVAGAVAAAILLNLALLGYAQPRNDPVGKLSPRAVLTGGAPAPARQAPPATTPAVTVSEHDDHDD